MRNLWGLKVCFLAGGLGQGGAERQLFYILKTLKAAGAELQLLCFTKGEFWEEIIQRLGVPVIWVGHRSRLKRIFRIVSALRKNPPMVLQSQHFFCNAYTAAAARLLGALDIGAMRSDGLNEVRDCGKAGGWLSLHAPRMLAANSRPAIHYARSQGVGPGRLYLLPNVVDTDALSRRPVDLSAVAGGNGKRTVRLILAGRLTEEKRVDRFLRVMARVRNNSTPLGKEVRAMVVGAGPLREALQEQARELGLWPEAVEFRGAVANMVPVYHQADVCVLTSDYEGTPNVLLEAMAAGLPILASNPGGVPDMVRHEETGILCDPADESAMVEGLVRLIEDADLRARMGTAAQRFVTTHHALALLPRFLQGLYEKTMNGAWVRDQTSRKAAVEAEARPLIRSSDPFTTNVRDRRNGT